LIGETVGPYRITAQLGAGGMGVVYEAEDLRLGRQVAVKFLADSRLNDHQARERFEREARAAAVLSHPHICVLHDVGEQDGSPYLVMERLHGASLRERLRAGPLPVAEVLRLGSQVADALEAAHRAGIVHRDIKPANIFLTEGGDAKLLDFGVASLRSMADRAGARSETDTDEALTLPGAVIGTAAYMSPEQVLGYPADARSDLFSLGVVLYELATGATPFPGDSRAAVVDAILNRAPVSPVRLNPQLPVEFERLVRRCLEKDARKRWGSAAELRAAIARCLEEIQGTASVWAILRRWARRPWAWAVAGLVVAALAAGLVAWTRHQEGVRWARKEALPKIRALSAGADFRYANMEAYELAERAEQIIPDDLALQELLREISTKPTFLTEPPGAIVSVKPYLEPNAPWQRLGETPLREVRLPLILLRWKVEKAGFVPIVRAGFVGKLDFRVGAFIPQAFSLKLAPEGSQPADMIRIESAGDIPEFLVDRYEVTNGQFKAFVDAGGYRERRWWKHEFRREGRVLPWDEAMRLFVDRTGLPGPSTWEAGSYSEGKADFPVGGVSWYEAAAFAEFARKSLPTLQHWWGAAGRPIGDRHDPVVLGNFGGAGPVAVGSTNAITEFGVADMAGNVREWCWNASEHGHCLRGGNWNDQTYMFQSVTQAKSLDRSETNGFRCVSYLDGKAPSEKLLAPFRPPAVRDYAKEKPVSEEVFSVFRRLFDYDARDLEARVETRDESNPDWIRERVSFTAAYGDERMIAQMFLPRTGRPPYQVVVYFPGADAIIAGSSDKVMDRMTNRHLIAHLLRAGRAVLYPVYQGTHERNGGRPDYYGRLALSGAPTPEYTEYQRMIVQDARRAIDYLEARPDVAPGKLAFYGFSWGGNRGPVILAVEPRFAAAILASAAFVRWANPPRPEADPFNYAPRVRLPVLMLNGRYDLNQPFESTARPLYELLGTRPPHKLQKVYEGDHVVPRTELIRESLVWLDRYLGPVGATAAPPQNAAASIR
jgi:eukaryotic-like serine/threonine-protein kinase